MDLQRAFFMGVGLFLMGTALPASARNSSYGRCCSRGTAGAFFAGVTFGALVQPITYGPPPYYYGPYPYDGYPYRGPYLPYYYPPQPSYRWEE